MSVERNPYPASTQSSPNMALKKGPASSPWVDSFSMPEPAYPGEGTAVLTDERLSCFHPIKNLIELF